jgi:hypothetical protein
VGKMPVVTCWRCLATTTAQEPGTTCESGKAERATTPGADTGHQTRRSQQDCRWRTSASNIQTMFGAQGCGCSKLKDGKRSGFGMHSHLTAGTKEPVYDPGTISRLELVARRRLCTKSRQGGSGSRSPRRRQVLPQYLLLLLRLLEQLLRCHHHNHPALHNQRDSG